MVRERYTWYAIIIQKLHLIAIIVQVENAIGPRRYSLLSTWIKIIGTAVILVRRYELDFSFFELRDDFVAFDCFFDFFGEVGGEASLMLLEGVPHLK